MVAKVLTLVAIALAVHSVPASAQSDDSQLQTWTGWFSDKRCARAPAQGETVRANGTACVQRCLGEGVPAVFLSEQENAVFDVRDYAAKNDVGYHVEVRGVVDRQGRSIAIRSVKRLSAVPASCGVRPPTAAGTRAGAGESGTAAILPALSLTTIDGRTIDPARLRGRPVVAAIWATWCNACHSIMASLDALQRQHGDSLTVIAIAVDSNASEVTRMAARLRPAYSIVMGTPEVIRAFGEVDGVPTLLLFDRKGARSHVLRGATVDVRERIDAALREQR